LSVTNREEGFDDFEAELISDKHQEKKLRKYRMVINMYNAGYSIKEIMSRTGYRGKSNIYRILHMYNVELEYPTMVRTRLLQPNVIQRNL
jgi:transposase